MNAPTSACLRRADRLRQGRVGDVADQHVLERVLALAGQPAARGRAPRDPWPAASRASTAGRCSARRRRPPSPPRRSARPPRPTASPGARCAGASRAGPRAPSAPSPAAPRSPRTPSSTIRLTISSANSGLPPERLATSPVSSARVGRPLAEQGGDQFVRLIAPERVEGERGRVHPPAAPARAPVEQLVARHADEQRRAAPPARQVLDQVEHPLVGPVDVLDREDHRLATARGVDQRAHGGEQALAHLLRVLGLGAVEPRAGGGLDPERPAERRREPLRRLLGLSCRRRGPRSRRGAFARPRRRRRCRRSRTSRGRSRPAPSRRARRRRRGSCRGAPPAGARSRRP